MSAQYFTWSSTWQCQVENAYFQTPQEQVEAVLQNLRPEAEPFVPADGKDSVSTACRRVDINVCENRTGDGGSQSALTHPPMEDVAQVCDGGVSMAAGVWEPLDPWLFLDAVELGRVSQASMQLFQLVDTNTPFFGWREEKVDSEKPMLVGDKELTLEKPKDTIDISRDAVVVAKIVSSDDSTQPVTQESACSEEVRDTHEVVKSCSSSQLVSVIAFGSIHCDNICDYLETFGKVMDLENQFSVEGRHVDVFSFEDAASAAAAVSAVTHYAPNDCGQSIRLEIYGEI